MELKVVEDLRDIHVRKKAVKPKPRAYRFPYELEVVGSLVVPFLPIAPAV